MSQVTSSCPRLTRCWIQAPVRCLVRRHCRSAFRRPQAVAPGSRRACGLRKLEDALKFSFAESRISPAMAFTSARGQLGNRPTFHRLYKCSLAHGQGVEVKSLSAHSVVNL